MYDQLTDQQHSSGVMEGLNSKVYSGTRKAFGFRSDEGLDIARFQTMRDLSEPKSTRRFCGRGFIKKLQRRVFIEPQQPAVQRFHHGVRAIHGI